MKASILLVEDDVEIAALTKLLLTEHGHRVTAKLSAEEGLDAILRQLPDLVLSDIHLPGLSGLRLLEILRGEPRTASLPIILLTVAGTETDKVRGLRSGADDYITKPFSQKELLARVDTVLRRSLSKTVQTPVLRIGDVEVDTERRETRLAGALVELRRKEFDLLVLLIQKQGRVLTKEFLTSALWKDEVIVTSNTINAQVKNLRQKLGSHGAWIETVIGEGYKLRQPE